MKMTPVGTCLPSMMKDSVANVAVVVLVVCHTSDVASLVLSVGY